MVNNSEHFWEWLYDKEAQKDTEYKPIHLYIEYNILEKEKSAPEDKKDGKSSSDVDFVIFQL